MSSGKDQSSSMRFLSSTIIGLRINSIVFIEDYVQLTFQSEQSSAILNILSVEEVGFDGGKLVVWGENECKLGLINLIGEQVKSIEYSHDLLVFEFDSNRIFSMRPEFDGEAFYLFGEDNSFSVINGSDLS